MDQCQESDYLPAELYDQITKSIPIVSVEALIVKDNALLFLRRNNQPVKGEWWFPGGRIRKGENFEQALYREIKEETDLELSSFRFLGVYSRVFPERHDITLAYLCKCKEGDVKLNEEHSECEFFSAFPKELHSFLLEVIKDSGLNDRKH